MKYLDEFRDPRIVRALLDRIARRVTRPWVLMEICGGQSHTMTVEFGLHAGRESVERVLGEVRRLQGAMAPALDAAPAN